MGRVVAVKNVKMGKVKVAHMGVSKVSPPLPPGKF